MNKILREKIQEALSSVLPITLIVLVLSMTITPMPVGTLVLFLAGAVLLIVGMAFFSLGTDVSMTPMGEGIGAQLPKTKNLAVVIAITLLIGILIVVVFFYFINLYYISPVLKITDALKNYLNSKIPFKVNVEGRDEMFRLKESIEKLIDQQKSKRNE